MSRKNRQVKVRWAIAMSVATVTVACSGPPQAPPPPPPEVGVTQPVRRDVTLYQEFTGTTRAAQSVNVRARVSGTLEEMHFEPSLPVREGQVLFIIEPLPYRAARDQADAALKAAEADLQRTTADLERLQVAVQSNAVSQSDVDLAQAQKNMAEASVLGAKAELDRAELEYSYTEVRAPIAGQVGRNLVDLGNVVSGSERTMLTSVNLMDPIHVYFNAPEEVVLMAIRYADLRRGDFAERAIEEDGREQEVFVATLADEGFPIRGIVDFVGNTVDADTGTIELRARVDNSTLQLFPGLFVRVRLPLTVVEDAILVEETAVSTDLGGRYVYVMGQDNLVEQQYVKTGPVEEDGMVPVAEGLDGSETYIVEGILRARPGMPASPQPVEGS